MATVVQPRRVLIVGDGDLSYSLALQRAFGSVIELTATVLPSAQELVATYANAAANAAELEGCGAAVRYGVDATALSSAELPTGGAVSGLYDHSYAWAGRPQLCPIDIRGLCRSRHSHSIDMHPSQPALAPT